MRCSACVVLLLDEIVEQCRPKRVQSVIPHLFACYYLTMIIATSSLVSGIATMCKELIPLSLALTLARMLAL